MVTSKEAPAKKIAKRTRTTTVRTVDSAATKGAAAPEALPAAPSPLSPKQKLVRDSFTMPRREYEQIATLKGRLLKVEHAIKKGELLRAGLLALTAMTDADLLALVARIQRLKTGRPEKSLTEAKPSTKKKR